ncbi:MAG: MFS transporter [Acidobacteriota bacterium]
MATTPAEPAEKPHPLKEITQPFVDLFHAPRALWGVNLAYFIEGLCYFGMLGYLAIYFTDFIFQGVPLADVQSHHMVMVLTAGITLSMFFLGFMADKFGVRKTLIWAFLFLLAGRLVISAAPKLGLVPDGMWSTLHLATMSGILLVVIGYGMYQPAAYTAVRKFTDPRTAGMAFAMLYALMNLGGYLPSWAFLLRDENYLDLGINGVFWVYTGLTLVALIVTVLILTPKTVKDAITDAKDQTEKIKAEEAAKAEAKGEAVAEVVAEAAKPEVSGFWAGVVDWMKHHPFTDPKFTCFIFALIPVQTLFVYNWMILPQYISRAYTGWIGEYFELAANFNPILIFIMVPIVTALTQKRKVYNMMILGTFIMAFPAFFLAVGTSAKLLFAYLFIMTIGEAMWQPRFLQYAAEIAPEGRTGVYMGVAQFPWFMTKVIVPLYSGHLLSRYCPDETTILAGLGKMEPTTMWFISGCIAMISCVLLILAKGWIGKDFKTKA